MAVLGIDRLLELVRTQKLVEGLADRELTSPEGAGFDIRVGEVYKAIGKAFLGVKDRLTPEATLVAKWGEHRSFTLAPNEFVLLKTIESFNVPDWLTMYTFPRSTLHRAGLLLVCTQTSPGYKGPLVLGLKNLGENDFEIELGARVAHVQFVELTGSGNAYKGQWQGGRVTHARYERQV